MATNRGGSITPNFPKGFLWKICAALLCYPFQILKTNRGGSIAPNFLKGFLSENLVLSNRCDAVLSISNTENKQGRFDSTKFSEGFSFRKFGAIEPLRCCVIHGGSIAPNFLKRFLSEKLVLSNCCAAVLSAAVLSTAVRKHQSFGRVVFQKTWCYLTAALLCYPLQMMARNRGCSITPIFLKDFLSEHLVLSNRCATVLSIANTENKQGRFDSTNFSGGFSFINLVLSNRCVAVLSIANDGNKQGRFDSTKFSEGLSLKNLVLSNRCAAVLSISNTENKQERFDSTKFSEGFLSEKLVLSNRCAAVLSIANTDNKHGRFDSTKFSEGLPLENLVLLNRCAAVLSMAVR